MASVTRIPAATGARAYAAPATERKGTAIEPTTHAAHRRRGRSGIARLLASEAVTGLGDGVFWVSFVVLLSHEPRFEVLLTVAVLVRLGPRALLSLAVGSLVDGPSLRRVLTAIDASRSVCMAALLALAWIDAPAWSLIACLLAFALLGVPTRAGMSLGLARLADEDHLASANATLSTIRQVSTFVGPTAGALVAAWSVRAGIATNAVAFALSAALLWSNRGIDAGGVRHDRRRPRPRGLAQLGAGFTATRSVAGLGSVVGLVLVLYVLRGAEMVLHVLLVTDLLHSSPGHVGAITAAIGVGAIVSAPVASRLARGPRPATAVLASIALSAVPTAAVVAAHDVTVAAAILFPVGIGMVVFEVVSTVTLQRAAPAGDLGGVLGVVTSASSSGKLLGATLAPFVVAATSVRSALIGVGALVAIAGAAAAPGLARVGDATALRRRALAPITDVLGRLSIFESASALALERLAAVVQPIDLAPGAVVIREGDPADDMFVIRSGSFDVTVRGDLINTMEPGDWFGEIGLVEGVARTATVTTRSAALVWRVPGDVFLSALQDSGDAPAALLDGIAERLARGAA